MQNPSQKAKRIASRLSSQCARLQQQEAELLEVQSYLQFKDRLLTGWLEILDLLKPTGVVRLPSYLAAHCLHLEQQQQQLLQQLDGNVPRSAAAAAARAAAAGAEEADAAGTAIDPLQTISPPDDPLAYLRDLATRPLAPGAAEMTTLQYIQHCKELCQQLGLPLQLLQNPYAPRLSAVDTIRELLDRHFHLTFSLIRCDKYDIVEAVKCFNLDTLQRLDDADAGAEDKASADLQMNNQDSIAAAVVPALELTPAQEDATACAMHLCEMLMGPITKEIQLLQTLMDVHMGDTGDNTGNISSSRGAGAGGIPFLLNCENSDVVGNSSGGDGGGDDGGGGGGGGGGGNAGGSGSGSGFAQAAAAALPEGLISAAGVSAEGIALAAAAGLPQGFALAAGLSPQGFGPLTAGLPQGSLEVQQQLLSRLRVVLKKQYQVTAATTAAFLGTLTWQQAARMVVYRWPYSCSMQYIAKAVWNQRDERLQQQQQQLQRQPQQQQLQQQQLQPEESS